MSPPYDKMHLMKNVDVIMALSEKLVEDFISMHEVGAIELEYWENARLLIEQYYEVSTRVDIGAKRA